MILITYSIVFLKRDEPDTKKLARTATFKRMNRGDENSKTRLISYRIFKVN